MGRRSRYDCAQPRRDQDGMGKCVSPMPTQEIEIALVGLMSNGACHTFLLLFSLLSWSPSFRCTESKDSSNFELSDFTPATACVIIPFLTHSFMLLCFM